MNNSEGSHIIVRTFLFLGDFKFGDFKLAILASAIKGTGQLLSKVRVANLPPANEECASSDYTYFRKIKSLERPNHSNRP